MIRKTKKHINWYVYIWLVKDGHNKNFRVHRLLAKLFIVNPEDKSQVNHINWIKHDNRLENLEWCTASENMQHAYKNNLINVSKWEKHWKYGVFWKDNNLSIKVNQLTLDWEFIKTWDSMADIVRELWFSKWNICLVCKWTRNQTWWFKWEYFDKGK